MSFIPKPHEIYKHFKGNLYQITAIAEHTETGEQLVVYQALYGDFKTYARPLAMFVSKVDRAKYPDCTQEFRFELQGPEAGRQREESQDMPAGWTGADKTASVQSGRAERIGQAVIEPVAGAVGMQPEKEQKGTAAEQATEEELSLDPMVLEFLDADEYGQRLNILAGLHHRITDEMITTMAIACDVEVGDGDVEERYEALKTCLLTLERYECNRLR